MRPRPIGLQVIVFSWLVCRVSVAADNAAALPFAEVQFTNPAPYSTAEELRRRFGFRQNAPEFVLAREKFQLLAPEDYATNGTWGALVWVSPGEDARVRPDWGPELARHRLLFVGAVNSGNKRNPFDRFRLALDAAFNMSHRFSLDPRRIYVGGFSGGSRIASMLGVAYADVFTGALCISGVNFYRDVPAGGGQGYPATYDPPQAVITAAKKNRFVFVTGEQDMNRQATKDAWIGGFKPNGFSNVLCLDVQGMKHELPGAPVLNTALNYLDQIPTPSSPAPARQRQTPDHGSGK
jgi:hypothetical protein